MAEKKEQKKSIKIKYTGKLPAVEVIGLGVFKRHKVAEIEDPQLIEKAKHLIKYNQEFKEDKS